MALTTTRNAGMLVLAIYLIVIGLTALVRLPIPLALTAVLALLAGVLILLGK
jgi:preprotein translocase subunit SecF